MKKGSLWAWGAAAVCGGLCFLWGRAESGRNEALAALEALKSDAAAAEAQAGEYMEAMAAAQVDADTLRAAVEERDALKTEKAELGAELKETRAAVISGEKSQAALTAALAEEKKKREEAEGLNLGYREQYDQLQAYVVSLESILEGYAEDPGAGERLRVIAELQERLAQSETEADGLRKEKEEWETKLTEAEERYAGAAALLRESGSAESEAQRQAAELKEELETTRERLTRAETELAGTAALLAESQKGWEKDQASLRLSQSKCASLTEEVREKSAAIERMEKQAAQARGQVAELQERLTESQLYAAGQETLRKEAEDMLAAARGEMQARDEEEKGEEEEIPEGAPVLPGRRPVVEK